MDYFIHTSVFKTFNIAVRGRELILTVATDGDDQCNYATIMCLGSKCPHIPFIYRAPQGTYSLAVKGKKTHKCCNIVCGILFLTEGSGQPQLSRVFQDVPKRRALSNTASHTGLSPSHTEIVARPVCVACLCWRVFFGVCVCARASRQ